ncbi:hypothetical protein HKCCE2091_00840 [Rhodobacterales bacterium HKCCE2091]|nr:hypothetical protein [Rhodobacterales bacterium HKCCE2091]
MSFLRPEVSALLRRWREPLAAVCVVALGLWIALGRLPVVPGFGWVLVLLGAALLLVAVRRAQFAGMGGGAGIVQVTEARVSYMGPFAGGTVSLDELSALSVRRAAAGPVWILREGGAELEIPADALGADRLIDAFAQLPGLGAARLIRARDTAGKAETPLWHRPQDGAPRLS